MMRDDDLSAAAPSILSRAAGLVVAVAGVLQALIGVQLLLAKAVSQTNFAGKPDHVAHVWALSLCALGAFVVFLGAKVARARTWAAIAATATTALLTMGSLVLMFVGGYLSVFGLFSPVVCLVAAALSGMSIPRALRADEARRRGMDLGV